MKEVVDAKKAVFSVAEVQEEILESHNMRISRPTIRKILKTDLDMRYRKVSNQMQYVNSDRNIILRQHFAKIYRKVISSGCLIINFDETALHNSDNRGYGWIPKGSSTNLNYRREY